LLETYSLWLLLFGYLPVQLGKEFSEKAMKNYRFALSLALGLVLAAVAFTGVRADGNDANNVPPAIGTVIADFKLPDVEGKNHSLSSLKGKTGTVLIFMSTQCPVVRDYNERIEKLAQDYRAKGVNVIGINSNVTESEADMKQNISDNKFSFLILKDKGNKIADTLGAQRTPEVYLLDASNKLVYRGRIDNHRVLAHVQANDLRDAIDATLAGKPVQKAETAAFGCSIKRG
jgi:peroxiredoxin